MGIKFIDEEKCSEDAHAIIKFVNCPHRIISSSSTTEDINAEYDKAFIRGKSEGFVPVLVSVDSILAEWFSNDELFSDGADYSKEKIFEDFSKEIKSSAKFFEEKCKEYFDDFDEDFEDYEEYKEYMEEDFFEEDDEYDGQDTNLLAAFADNEIILFEIPVKNPWEIVAWLPFGGFNDCPNPVEMMAICKYWYEEYGAVPAAISHDTMEFKLKEPVSDEETAWELAKQHSVFCSECIASGTLSEITYSILDARVWYFWWD